MKQTLREAVESNFAGYEAHRLEFWCPEELPNEDWSNQDYQQVQRFSKGEYFEEIALRTWRCTDTEVGLYAITWAGQFIGFTYQSARKSGKIWYFAHENIEEELRAKFNTYYVPEKFEPVCRVLDSSSELYDTELSPDYRHDWMTGPITKTFG